MLRLEPVFESRGRPCLTQELALIESRSCYQRTKSGSASSCGLEEATNGSMS